MEIAQRRADSVESLPFNHLSRGRSWLTYPFQPIRFFRLICLR